VLVAVLCAAMTGLTYAVVALSKDSKVGDNGVMVVKGTNTPVATGGASPGQDLNSQPGTALPLATQRCRNQVLQPSVNLASLCACHQPRRPGDGELGPVRGAPADAR
jgi:hypothetical protein